MTIDYDHWALFWTPHWTSALVSVNPMASLTDELCCAPGSQSDTIQQNWILTQNEMLEVKWWSMFPMNKRTRVQLPDPALIAGTFNFLASVSYAGKIHRVLWPFVHKCHSLKGCLKKGRHFRKLKGIWSHLFPKFHMLAQSLVLCGILYINATVVTG